MERESWRGGRASEGEERNHGNHEGESRDNDGMEMSCGAVRCPRASATSPGQWRWPAPRTSRFIIFFIAAACARTGRAGGWPNLLRTVRARVNNYGARTAKRTTQSAVTRLVLSYYRGEKNALEAIGRSIDAIAVRLREEGDSELGARCSIGFAQFPLKALQPQLVAIVRAVRKLAVPSGPRPVRVIGCFRPVDLTEYSLRPKDECTSRV